MPVQMPEFWVTSFFFVSSIFSKSIFAVGIPRTTTWNHFRVNFALLPRTFVQPSSSLNFSVLSILVIYIATSLLSRIHTAQSLVVVILFSIRYASILCATFLGLAFSSLLQRHCRWASLLFRFFCCRAEDAAVRWTRRMRRLPRSAIWGDLILLHVALWRPWVCR